jgi:hypothetical protein
VSQKKPWRIVTVRRPEICRETHTQLVKALSAFVLAQERCRSLTFALLRDVRIFDEPQRPASARPRTSRARKPRLTAVVQHQAPTDDAS